MIEDDSRFLVNSHTKLDQLEAKPPSRGIYGGTGTNTLRVINLSLSESWKLNVIARNLLDKLKVISWSGG